MTGTKKKDPVVKKQVSSSPLPLITRTTRRTQSPIVADAELSHLTEENRTLFHLMENKFESKFNELINILHAKEAKIEKLERENTTLKMNMDGMLERLDGLEMEWMGRQTDVILSGESVPVGVTGEDTSAVATTTLRTLLNYSLPTESISSAYRLGKPPVVGRPDKRNILLKLSTERIKDDIVWSGRSVKPPGLYINENLTPLRAGLLYSLRKLKKKCPDRIDHCGSIRGKCYIWLKFGGDRSRNRKLFINSKSALQDLIVKELQLDLDQAGTDGLLL